MPSCVRRGKALSNLQSIYYATEDGFEWSQPKTVATFYFPDTTATDYANCGIVTISGAEYNSLTSRIAVLENRPSATPGSSTVNVTAEIFVGAALVACFVLGWIAGAQR